MKIDKQLPVTTTLDTRARAQTQLSDAPLTWRRVREKSSADAQPVERLLDKGSSFNLQLNQQLSSMQSAERYLSTVAEHLSTLKLSLSRQLSSAQTSGERDKVTHSLQQLNSLLEQRAKASGESLDASFKLRLNEPLRSRFNWQGLESIDRVQRSGKETLLFSAGRHLPEPVAVVLDDDMSHEQILRRFNISLGQVGIRAELSQEGALKFSAPEQTWQPLKEQLKVQGEDKLFAKSASALVSQDDELLDLPLTLGQKTVSELRQLLDSVISALDRVSTLREQISQRQTDVREFLARQESQDEKQWAQRFAGTVFSLNGDKSAGYTVISQAVVAQSNLSRYAVVSLLS
ncbi:hypothetical protein SAMN04487857_103289 [Pseudomonas sp. ok272]|uniref:hypothetical protein n=1 Tax=unclassified Pseudomonas TaxID=196821 RepID=UPI0008CE174E|nr:MULTISPECIES: hypothetical protein [unclassified Pseudomonas]SEM62797.1 hypothetical protein SAMN04487857_103289 [Pseudomonas sp. ok272]SFM47353.1 hypothetical protein SAMN04487858_103146 [Pseudomonas sp. ok602]